MKYLYLILFSGLILFKPVAQLSWEVWYYVNIDYVAEELCENQEEPELECNGKCYLAKQLAKAESENTPEQPDKPVNPFLQKEQAMCYCWFPPTPVIELEELQRGLVPYTSHIKNRSLEAVFHPPQA